jgi:polyisoprenoid-binding protein YceI
MSTHTVTPLPTGTWSLDQVHSRVGFAVDYLVGTVRAGFAPFQASLDVDEDGNASLVGSTRAENVTLAEPKLVGHLLAEDFFDNERTPELRFVSTSIERNGEDVTVHGDLTIRGRTLPVELAGSATGPITDPMGNERLGLRLATTVDRRSFGLEWNLPLPNGGKMLADEVTLEAELFFTKK